MRIRREKKIFDYDEQTATTDGSGEQRKMEETGCEVICGATTTPAVEGWVKVKEGEAYSQASLNKIAPCWKNKV